MLFEAEVIIEVRHPHISNRIRRDVCNRLKGRLADQGVKFPKVVVDGSSDRSSSDGDHLSATFIHEAEHVAQAPQEAEALVRQVLPSVRLSTECALVVRSSRTIEQSARSSV